MILRSSSSSSSSAQTHAGDDAEGTGVPGARSGRGSGSSRTGNATSVIDDPGSSVGMVLLGWRDDFLEVRLDLLEIRESIRGPGILGGWSVRGRSRFRSQFGRKGQQFRDVGDAGPGNHGSRRTYE